MSDYSIRAGKMVLLFFLFLTSFVVLPVHAESTPDSPAVTAPNLTAPHPAALEEMKFLQEETVVTATRQEQPISQSPSDIYVITDEDIRQSGAIDIPTILRSVPGMEVMQTTAANFNVSARGDNQLLANKMLAMVNWRSIYVDSQGTVRWKAIPVTLPEIKRIEVLKGPASAIYGFNAFDGIVHIITKSPEEMKGTTLQFGGGEFGTISSAAIYGGAYKNLGYKLSIGRDQTNQWDDRNALGFRSNKFNVETVYSLPNQSKLEVSGGLIDVNRFDGPVTEVTIQQSQPLQGYAYVTYERPNFFLRSFWNRNDTESTSVTNPLLANLLQTTDQTGNPTSDNKSDTYNVLGQYTMEFGTAHQISYGVNYRYIGLSSDLIDSSSEENRLGLYVQDVWEATQAFTAIAGFRFDMDTFINPTYSPRVALLFKAAEGHTLRASVSVAYRPPTLLETNLDIRTQLMLPGLPPLSFMTLGSSNLDPEQIVSYGIGYQGWFFKHRLRARVDLFFNHLSDLIDFVPTGPAPTDPVIAMNADGSADIYGGEAGAEFLITPWLSGFANVAYQEFDQTFTGITKRAGPKWKVNGGLRAEWESGLSGEALVHFVDATTWPIANAFTAFAPFGATVPDPRVGSYTLLNLRGAYRFWEERAASGHARYSELALSAFNALNDRHKEHPLGETIKSRVMGWLTIRF